LHDNENHTNIDDSSQSPDAIIDVQNETNDLNHHDFTQNSIILRGAERTSISSDGEATQNGKVIFRKL